MLPMYDSPSSGDEDDRFALRLPKHQLLGGSCPSDNNVDNDNDLASMTTFPHSAEDKPKAKKARVEGYMWSPQMVSTHRHLSFCTPDRSC